MDRARLLSGLVAQPAFEDEWDAEIQRRSQAIESGEAETFSHEDAMEFIFGARRMQAG